MRTLRHKQPAHYLLLAALVLTIGGVALSSPASGAPAFSEIRANRAVKALIRSDLIRAEIVTYDGVEVGDVMVYRGVVRKVRGRLLTLTERDGSIVRVRLSPATEIRIDARKVRAKLVRRGMRATFMYRSGNAAATWLYVAKRQPDRSGPKIKLLLSDGFVRYEVISWSDGEVLDSRADTGAIASVDDTSLTLEETDGTTVDMQIDSATLVRINNNVSAAVDLIAGMKTTTIGDGGGLIGQIWAFDTNLSRDNKK